MFSVVNLAQSTAASRDSEKSRHQGDSPAALWERPGFKRQELLRAAVRSRNSVLEPSTSLPGRIQTRPVAATPAHHPANLTVDIHATSLKRSGAVRHKHGSPFAARSVSFQDSPVSARPKLSSRAETWAATADYSELREEAEDYLTMTLGTDKYNQVKGSAEGEQLIQDVIREQFRRQLKKSGQHAADCDEAHAHTDRCAQLRGVQGLPTSTMHVPGLQVKTDVPSPADHQPSDGSTVVTRTLPTSERAPRDEADWAESYKLYQKSLYREA